MTISSILRRLLPSALRPLELATRRYLCWSKCIVQSGPFQGLKYIRQSHCSALTPKIAGTYERELFPFLERLIASKPDAFIDIGAAEGYYVVGAAVAGWSPRIIAFESDPHARESLLALANLNGLPPERITLHEACTPRSLDTLLASCKNPAVILDTEGFEALLLDPLRLPNLKKARFIVEYHDFILPGLRDVLIERMQATHNIEIIGQSPRTADELSCTDPILRLFPASIRLRLLSESRPPERHGWLWMEPRT
ncbi:MAG TPA: hypothetical protein VL357_06205 [Rariglobus sp.]|jgi:hypothetical protein|nr:hypothetical protein [Rariglobus sp.]